MQIIKRDSFNKINKYPIYLFTTLGLLILITTVQATPQDAAQRQDLTGEGTFHRQGLFRQQQKAIDSATKKQESEDIPPIVGYLEGKEKSPVKANEVPHKVISGQHNSFDQERSPGEFIDVPEANNF